MAEGRLIDHQEAIGGNPVGYLALLPHCPKPSPQSGNVRPIKGGSVIIAADSNGAMLRGKMIGSPPACVEVGLASGLIEAGKVPPGGVRPWAVRGTEDNEAVARQACVLECVDPFGRTLALQSVPLPLGLFTFPFPCLQLFGKEDGVFVRTRDPQRLVLLRLPD